MSFAAIAHLQSGFLLGTVTKAGPQ